MKLTDREPKLSRTASLLLAAGLTFASLGLAACQREESWPVRTLTTSGVPTVTPWKPEAQPRAAGIPTSIPRNTPIPTPTTNPELVKNCPKCPPPYIWIAAGKYCQGRIKPTETTDPTLEDCSSSSNSCFPGYGCNPPEQRNVAPSLAQPRATAAPAVPTAQPRPPEAQKPAASEGKISLSKKPDGLFRALLTTPFLDNELPGFSLKTISANDLSPTDKAFKAVGRLDIFVHDGDPRLRTPAFAAITYVIFPDIASARGAYDNMATQSGPGNRRALQITESPIVVFPNLGALQVENVLIETSYRNFFGERLEEEKIINLAVGAVKHLQRVGR